MSRLLLPLIALMFVLVAPVQVLGATSASLAQERMSAIADSFQMFEADSNSVPVTFHDVALALRGSSLEAEWKSWAASGGLRDPYSGQGEEFIVEHELTHSPSAPERVPRPVRARLRSRGPDGASDPCAPLTLVDDLVLDVPTRYSGPSVKSGPPCPPQDEMTAAAPSGDERSSAALARARMTVLAVAAFCHEADTGAPPASVYSLTRPRSDEDDLIAVAGLAYPGIWVDPYARGGESLIWEFALEGEAPPRRPAKLQIRSRGPDGLSCPCAPETRDDDLVFSVADLQEVEMAGQLGDALRELHEDGHVREFASADLSQRFVTAQLLARSRGRMSDRITSGVHPLGAPHNWSTLSEER